MWGVFVKLKYDKLVRNKKNLWRMTYYCETDRKLINQM